jgi:DNA-binding SARP family transcriptional activator
MPRMVRRPSVAAMTEPIRAVPTSRPEHSESAPVERASDYLEPYVRPRALLAIDERPAVIRSKIQPPPLRPSTLSRQRLLDRLSDATGSRLTLVVAEAGYGKTTLLADFSSRASARCLWYKLDASDADPITWTNHVIAAAREVDPEFGRATLALLAQVAPGGPPESAFVASLLGELPKLGEAPTILVLDDFHLVDASDEARTYVSRLIRDAPLWLRFVISSRRRLPLELARLAGMGEVVEITTDDLRFTNVEMDRLFADGYGVVLEPDVLLEVGQRTGGWAASLQLFHGSIRGRPSSAVRALAKALSGADAPMYDFLAQEVLKNITNELEEFLIRASLLERIVPNHAVALFIDRRGLAPDVVEVRSWIDEADRLGLLARASHVSDARHFHPLLREFLKRRLTQRHTGEAVRSMHLSLARAIADDEPLVACQHFIEGGDQGAAMKCLGRSIVLAMGSGQWGVASGLSELLDGVTADPAVAAIRARRLVLDGELEAAKLTLSHSDLAEASPDVRAAFRHAQFSLAWRSGDREAIFEALRAIQSDPETPRVLRDIAEVFVDTSPLAARRAPLPSLARRLLAMARRHAREGLDFYAAVGYHNASVAFLNSGDLQAVHSASDLAIDRFHALPFNAAEVYSTHAIRATAQLELGHRSLADEEAARALASGDEFADVPSELALNALALGDQRTASMLLTRAEALVREERTDVVATLVYETARAVSDLPARPRESIARLQQLGSADTVDFGQLLTVQYALAMAYLLAGEADDSLAIAQAALAESRDRLGRRAEARLAVLVGLARGDAGAATDAIDAAAELGHLALAELADVIGNHLDMLQTVPKGLEENVARWPGRWLPILRRQLDRGDTPSGRVAARLLDRYGELQDVTLLRAFARTYRYQGRIAAFGIELAERVSPRLQLHDLGRVSVAIGERIVGLSSMRRKPASLLMYLVTRPGFTANREQIFDELWPDNDPASASNSLNQSLYFLRRELDPWYEDDFSVDYVALQGELVWLDPKLVGSDSAKFMLDAQKAMRSHPPLAEIADLVAGYRGPFAPEFEYEEWAMAWRSRVHATFLELASRTIDRALLANDLAGARDVAVSALEADPDNAEIERSLVWLYWHLGARGAAHAQYDHLASLERADGLEPTPLEAVVARTRPE